MIIMQGYLAAAATEKASVVLQVSAAFGCLGYGRLQFFSTFKRQEA